MATSPYKTWLNSPRIYAEGLLLLNSGNCSGIRLKMLQSGPGPLNTPKLHQTIADLSKQPAPPPEKVAEPQPVATVQPVATSPEKPVEKKLVLQKRIADLWMEICDLHGAKSEVKEGPRLHQIAKRILLLNQQRQHLWDQLEYYQETGSFFDELPENQPKPYNLQQEIKNVMSYRAKAKKALAKCAHPAERKRLHDKMDEYDRQLENLRKKRNA